MKLKLLGAYKGFKAGDIIEADEATAKFLLDGGIAEKYDEAKDAKEAEQKALRDSISTAIKSAFGTLVPKAPEVPKDEKAYKGLGGFLNDVQKAGTGDRDAHGRLVKAAQGMNETTDADGGYLVHPEWMSDVMSRMIDSGALARKCRRVRCSSNELRFNEVDDYNRTDGNHAVNVYRIAEAADKTKSTPQFGEVTVPINKLVGLYYATDELLQDVSALEMMVGDWFVREFGYKMDYEVLRGTGTTMFDGILASSALVTQAKESAQTADTVNAANVAKMYARMWPGSLGRAEWFVNPDVLPQLINMQIGNYPIFTPPGGIPGAPAGTLLGRPINVSEVCSTVGDVGDIMFMDLGQYLIAERGGLEQASSIHVRFVQDETCFRFVLRNGGAPSWSNVVTPNQGSNTLSPFIALAAR